LLNEIGLTINTRGTTRVTPDPMANQPEPAAMQTLREEIAALELRMTQMASTIHPPVVPAMAPALGRFALTPALANKHAYLDLDTPKGTKLYNKGTVALAGSPFDFEDPTDLNLFLDAIKSKSKAQGWSRIFTIPTTSTKTEHLLQSYGLVTLKAATADALKYYDTETKEAQDSFMLYQCLIASVTQDFMRSINTERVSYHLGSDDTPVGTLFLKIIISKVHVDSRATVGYLRLAIGKLDTKMLECNSDVTQFNQYVKRVLMELVARGERSDNEHILINIFHSYATVADTEFRAFTSRKREVWEEGEDISVAELMALGEHKFKSIKLSGKWQAPTDADEKIIALSARFEERMNKPLKNKSKPNPKSKRMKEGKSFKEKMKARIAKWAWTKVPPKEGEPVTKIFEGRTFHLECANHPNQWVCHTTEECYKNASKLEAKRSAEKGRLKQAQIAAAAVADDEDSPYYESEDDFDQ
jgi:hypothetical protein